MIHLDVGADWCLSVTHHLEELGAEEFAQRIDIERTNCLLYDQYSVKLTDQEHQSIATTLLIARITYENNGADSRVAEIEQLAKPMVVPDTTVDVETIRAPHGECVDLFDALLGEQSVEFST